MADDLPFALDRVELRTRAGMRSVLVATPRHSMSSRLPQLLLVASVGCGPATGSGGETDDSETSAGTHTPDAGPGDVCYDAVEPWKTAECETMLCAPGDGVMNFVADGLLECADADCKGLDYVGQEASLAFVHWESAKGIDSTSSFHANLRRALGSGRLKSYQSESTSMRTEETIWMSPDAGLDGLIVEGGRLRGTLTMSPDTFYFFVEDSACDLSSCSCVYENVVSSASIHVDLALP